MEFYESHEMECPKCKAKLNLTFERKPFDYKLELEGEGNSKD